MSVLLNATFFPSSRHKMNPFYDEVDEAKKKKRQHPYDNPKFYTAMRHRLHHYNLPASVLTYFIALHTILYDADKGRFYRDDVAIRRITGLPKSTAHQAFVYLTTTSLIRPLEDGSWEITHYEQDRTMAKSYFRLSPPLLKTLSTLVSHHAPMGILFALELVDRSRHFNADVKYGMSTLIREWKLGSCPSRVYKMLELLSTLSLWTLVPNQKETEDNVHFHLVKVQRDKEQEKLRALHGSTSRNIKESYRFAGGTDTITWYELSKLTRRIIQHGIDHKLPDRDMLRLGSLYGAYCARNHIRRRVPYLSIALKKGLADKLNWMAS